MTRHVCDLFAQITCKACFETYRALFFNTRFHDSKLIILPTYPIIPNNPPQISYFIPEDGDSEDHPNIFLMQKPTQSGFSPRLRDIKESFPMPGTYHFRFKTPLIPGTDREKGAFAVWMDCTHDDQHVGVWRNTIFAKVTRISMEDDDDEDIGGGAEDFYHATPAPVPSTRTAAAPQQRQRTQQQPPARAAAPDPVVAESDNLLGVFDEQPAAAPAAPPSNEGNLLDVPTGPPPSHQSGEASLLDMNGPAYSADSNVGVSNHDDFLGMTSQPVSANPTPPVSGSAPAPMQQAPSSFGNPLGGSQSQRAMSNGNGNNNAFNTFSQNNGPFGGLNWQ